MSDKQKLTIQLRAEAQAGETFRGRLKDLTATFKDNRVRFGGLIKTYSPLAEDGEKQPDDRKEVGTTVKHELAWFAPFFAKGVDEAMTKEITNQFAKADLKVLGLTFSGMPATALLNLENKLKELKTAVTHIPVLDDAKTWVPDNVPVGTSRQEPDEWTYRTEKKPYNHMKAEATDKHPAQVEVLYRDENIGRWTKRVLSGAISVSAKAALLSRCDEAIAAVVKAREEANQVEVVEMKGIGKQIYDALFSGLI